MRRRQRFFVLILAFLMLSALIERIAADEGITAELSTETDSLTVGDPVMLTLTVTHPEGARVIVPDLGQTWGDFEVRSQSAPQIIPSGDGTEVTTQTIEVTLFAPGTFETPPLTVQVVGVDGTSEAFTAEPVSLSVISVLQEGDTDLRDIKPQASLPIPSVLPYVLGAAAALMIILAGIFWAIRRRRKRPVVAAPVVDLRPAYQIALDELAEVERMGLVAEGQFKAHYTLVSDVLRRYLERGFGISAVDQTTGEIRRAVKHSQISKDHARMLIDLLSDADMVKFAKYLPDIDEAHEVIPNARYFIELSRQPAPTMPTTVVFSQEAAS